MPLVLTLPVRPGDPPDVTTGIPHIQLNQTSSDEVLSELATWAFALEGIVQQPSRASLPGARALTVAPGLPANAAAMIVGREFAHVHPQPNGGSLHLRLPPQAAGEVVRQGWGEYHPFALDGTLPGLVMVYAARDGEDLSIVKSIVEASVAYAVLAAELESA